MLFSSEFDDEFILSEEDIREANLAMAEAEKFLNDLIEVSEVAHRPKLPELYPAIKPLPVT